METWTISALAGALLSLIFWYVPGANRWYLGLDGEHKRVVMLAALVAVVVIQYIMACVGVGQIEGVRMPTCDQVGLWTLAQNFIAALVANQSVFQISPASKKQ